MPQGKWSKDEDAELRALVEEQGKRCTEIGGMLGRMAESCKDRWKEIRLGGAKKNGAWSEEEVERLRTAVEEYLAAKSVSRGVWGFLPFSLLGCMTVIHFVSWHSSHARHWTDTDRAQACLVTCRDFPAVTRAPCHGLIRPGQHLLNIAVTMLTPALPAW